MISMTKTVEKIKMTINTSIHYMKTVVMKTELGKEDKENIKMKKRQ